jgi:hypothetical protein
MRLEMVRDGKSRIEKSRLQQDKGHRGEWNAFSGAVSGKGIEPISFEETIVVMMATFGIVDSLRQSIPIKVISPIG